MVGSMVLLSICRAGWYSLTVHNFYLSTTGEEEVCWGGGGAFKHLFVSGKALLPMLSETKEKKIACGTRQGLCALDRNGSLASLKPRLCVNSFV